MKCKRVDQDYESFIESKRIRVERVGFDVSEDKIHPKLFPFQRAITRWAIRRGRAAVFADCLAGESIVHSPDGDISMEAAYESDRRIKVFSLVGGKIATSEGSVPFINGVDRLYRYSFASGNSVVATRGHRFLSCSGWKRGGSLRIGECLAVSDPNQLRSIVGSSPSVHCEDDLHLQQTTGGCLANCLPCCRQCDGRSRMGEGICEGLIPSRDDVRVHTQHLLRMDGMEHRSRYTRHRLEKSLLSIGHSSSLVETTEEDGGYQPLSFASLCNRENNRSDSPAHVGISLARRADGSLPLEEPRNVGDLSEPCKCPPGVCWDTLVAVDYIRTDVFYDMEVLGTANFLANGVWSHNCGLGKTFISLEWARLIGEKTLIVAPLSVARQTVREARKIDLEVHYVRSQAEVTGEHLLWITNYEMLQEFDPDQFGAVILDESSILKSLSGKIRTKLISMFSRTKFRLCCTATPAPNDFIELGNHAHFLGVSTTAEMLSMFFINANKQQVIVGLNGETFERKGSNAGGQEWRIKHHAEQPFFKWLASWAMAMSKPSDLDFDDDGFVLPELRVHPIFAKTQYVSRGELIFTGLHGIEDRVAARRATVKARLEELKKLVSGSSDQWIVWCGLDDESKAVAEAIKGSVEVVGSDPPEKKAAAFEDFQDGKFKVLVTKAKIGGYGMNFQCAHKMAFFGLSDSWEMYYQAVRREWRYGQQHPVDVYVLMSEPEAEVYHNVMRKEGMAARLRGGLVASMRKYEEEELRMETEKQETYVKNEASGRDWRLLLGDSCERLKEIQDDSIDMSIYSPPFMDLFVYSATNRDLGNCRNREEFFEHYKYIIREVLRVTKPGRLTCVHTSDIPAMQSRDGYIGLKDFPGDVIRAYQACGWTFVGRAFVSKNPQAQAIRVKSKALLFVQLRKDSSDSRPALVDQILFLKKPGDNDVPVRPVDNGEMDNETWIEWANGIWLDVSECDTLNIAKARAPEDEKHICPLQLGTIERCVKLYSNPGELVLSPFAGIGSEGYVSVKFGRRFIGIELKESYWRQACKNLRKVEHDKDSILSMFGEESA